MEETHVVALVVKCSLHRQELHVTSWDHSVENVLYFTLISFASSVYYIDKVLYSKPLIKYFWISCVERLEATLILYKKTC